MWKTHLSPVFTRVKIFSVDLLDAADVCAGQGYCIALALTTRAHLGQGRMIGGLPPLRPRKLITADTVLSSIAGLYAHSGFAVKTRYVKLKIQSAETIFREARPDLSPTSPERF